MKRFRLACLFACVFSLTQAQDFSKLTAPASPAFSILNFEPSAVMRPTTARSLATDLLTSFDEDGKLLPNIGMEFSPYWLKSRPRLTRQTYLHPNVGQTFLQTLSISVATVRDSATKENRFGGGFRFRLANGKPVAALDTISRLLGVRRTEVAVINGFANVLPLGTTKKQAVTQIVRALRQSNTPDSVVRQMEKQAKELEKDFSDDEVKDFLLALVERRVESYADLAARSSGLLYQRQGFVLEFAGAAGYARGRSIDLDKVGLWANASYGVSADDLLTLTARYQHRDTDSLLNNVDAGIGYLKKTTRYNLAFEFLVRRYRAEINVRNAGGAIVRLVDKQSTWRAAFQGAYFLGQDISVNVSLGKDFATPFISASGFFSILGLNFSLFNREPAQLLQQ